MYRKHALLAALGTAGLALGLVSAPASALTCGQWVVDPALSCQDGVGQTDSAADIDSLYPRAEPWEYIDKDENIDPANDSPPSPPWTEADFYLTDDAGNPFDPGNDTSGFFYISSAILSAYEELVLVMKGGNTEPRWAAFLLDLPNLSSGPDGYQHGTWSSRQGLSHATLYGNGDQQNVPEPGSLALLGLGLAGLGMARRRKTA